MPSRESGGAFAHRGVITEFMQEMDGLKTSRADNIMVIGATNRPFDLDDAILRRLPRRLLVDLPGAKEREGELSHTLCLNLTHVIAHCRDTEDPSSGRGRWSRCRSGQSGDADRTFLRKRSEA